MLHKYRHFVKGMPGYLDKRALIKSRLNKAYTFFAFNAFALVVYACFTGKADWVDYYGLRTEEEKFSSQTQLWQRKLKIENAKTFKISGFSFVETNEEEKEQIKKKYAE